MQRHHYAHAALCAVYLVTAVALLIEGAYAHCGCALAAAAVYAFLCWPAEEGGGGPSGSESDRA